MGWKKGALFVVVVVVVVLSSLENLSREDGNYMNCMFCISLISKQKAVPNEKPHWNIK